MAVFLFKLVFFAISTVSNLLSRLIFTATAQLFVLFIQGFRVPGQAMQGGLEQVANAIRACFEYILELLVQLISTLISSAFEFLIDSVTSSAAVTGSAIGGLVEQTRTALDGFLKDYLSDLAGEFSEMISTIVSDLWNNYKEAVGYVSENASA